MKQSQPSIQNILTCKKHHCLGSCMESSAAEHICSKIPTICLTFVVKVRCLQALVKTCGERLSQQEDPSFLWVLLPAAAPDAVMALLQRVELELQVYDVQHFLTVNASAQSYDLTSRTANIIRDIIELVQDIKLARTNEAKFDDQACRALQQSGTEEANCTSLQPGRFFIA